MELEEMLYNTVIELFGGPLIVGIIMIVFFIALAAVVGLKGQSLILVGFASLIATAAFIPELRIIAGIGIGGVVGMAALKLVRR